MLSPLTYANTIIRKALETRTPLSPMKLQKLLYLLYARTLFLHNDTLFSEQFEKWQFGPVLPVIYDAFKRFRDRPIDEFYYNADGQVAVVGRAFTEFYDCFDEVWNRFGGLNGIELSRLTHRAGTAWCKTGGIILKQEDIREDGEKLFAP